MRNIERVAFWTGKWTNADQSQLLILDVDLQAGNFNASLVSTEDPTKSLGTAEGTGGFTDSLEGHYTDSQGTKGKVELRFKSLQSEADDLSGNQIEYVTSPDLKKPIDKNASGIVFTNVSGPSALVPDLETNLEKMNSVRQKIDENVAMIHKVSRVMREFSDRGVDVSSAHQPLEEQRDKMLEFVNFIKVRLHLLSYTCEEFANLIQPIDFNFKGLLSQPAENDGEFYETSTNSPNLPAEPGSLGSRTPTKKKVKSKKPSPKK